jgi:hypothetical protein
MMTASTSETAYAASSGGLTYRPMSQSSPAPGCTEEREKLAEVPDFDVPSALTFALAAVFSHDPRILGVKPAAAFCKYCLTVAIRAASFQPLVGYWARQVPEMPKDTLTSFAAVSPASALAYVEVHAGGVIEVRGSYGERGTVGGW